MLTPAITATHMSYLACLIKQLPLDASECLSSFNKLFDGMKGMQMASGSQRSQLLNILTSHLEDSQLAEIGMSLYDKFSS